MRRKQSNDTRPKLLRLEGGKNLFHFLIRGLAKLVIPLAYSIKRVGDKRAYRVVYVA